MEAPRRRAVNRRLLHARALGQSLTIHHSDCKQVYYEINAERKKRGLEQEIAIVRLEQLAPFPFDLVGREIRRYPNAEIIWCQEEPLNMVRRVIFELASEWVGIIGPLRLPPSPAARRIGRSLARLTLTDSRQLITDY